MDELLSRIGSRYNPGYDKSATMVARMSIGDQVLSDWLLKTQTYSAQLQRLTRQIVARHCRYRILYISCHGLTSIW
jgi:hypothetical protein